VIHAADPAEPLPSELLEPSGVAAWVLRPVDLDRLGVLTAEPYQRPLTVDGRDPDELELPTPGAAPDPTVDAPSDPLAAYRPDPQGVWPDTHLTLSYGELRRLIALHLAQLAATMPRDRPWLYADARAKAMADGETPLRLREVME
jgi:hypothetical protein